MMKQTNTAVRVVIEAGRIQHFQGTAWRVSHAWPTPWIISGSVDLRQEAAEC